MLFQFYLQLQFSYKDLCATLSLGALVAKILWETYVHYVSLARPEFAERVVKN